MQRLRSHLLGIDQGDVALFSDFEDGGAMWVGEGARERRRTVSFAESFRSPPTVHVSVSLWDADSSRALRAEVVADNITPHDFELVFRTWGDSRFARLRAAWLAFGALHDPEEWEVL